MKTLLLVISIALFAAIGFAQSDLPDIGTIADVKGKSKVYVAADSQNTKLILKVIAKAKTLSVVNSPDDAEFFIEYKTLQHDASAGLLAYVEGELSEVV